MSRPSVRVIREQQPGLWEATASFAVQVSNVKALLAPVTAAAFTRQSPLPDPNSRCQVGSIRNVPIDRHLSPQTLISNEPFKHDFVPLVVPEAQLSSDIPGLGHPQRLGDAADMSPRTVKVAVWRNSSAVTLNALLTAMAAPVTRTRSIQPPGGIVGVDYSSIFRLELQDNGQAFQAEDAGAPVVQIEDDHSLTAIGVVLLCESDKRALVTNIQRIFNRLPMGSGLL